MKNKYHPIILKTDCLNFLEKYPSAKDFRKFDLTFYDPPFNQKKEYASHNDNMPEEEYWNWMETILTKIYENTSDGGAIYFMQREKNVDKVMIVLKNAGWNFRNLIIWKKLSSAVPNTKKFGLSYQIIVYAIKGDRPRVFNRLRNDPILNVKHKQVRENGAFLTDIWDDIRELTSGYFAGSEPLLNENHKRLHNQQSPVHLLLRIILSSTKKDDLVFDPFAGTGTTGIVSTQLNRNSLSIEIASVNYNAVVNRFKNIRDEDNIIKYINLYSYTPLFNDIIGNEKIKIHSLKKQIPTETYIKLNKKLIEFIKKNNMLNKLPKNTLKLIDKAYGESLTISIGLEEFF